MRSQNEIEQDFKKFGYTKTAHTKDVIKYDDLSIDGTPSRLIKPCFSGDDYRACINHDKIIEISNIDKSVYTGEDVGVISDELNKLIQEQCDIFFN